MNKFRSGNRFNPLERAQPLSQDQEADFGIASYTKPKATREIDGVHFVEQRFRMRDGWEYDTVSTVIPDDKLMTSVSGTMTTGWFTNNERGFNGRRLTTLGKRGTEWTSVSVPLNMDRGWGDMEANAYNQARIGRAMAVMLGRHPELFFEDGLSRGAMTGESVIGVSPEVGADVIFGYNTVPCRIEGVEEIDQLAELVKGLHPANLGRAALRGEFPSSLYLPHVIHTIRKAGRGLNEAFGNELKPITELVSTPLDKMRNGASINEAISETIGKFHPDSMAVPYKILSRYPTTADITPRRLFRQCMEAYTLTNGTYGKLAEKVSSDQFQVITGFLGDGLSHYEEIVKRHDTKTHPHTIVETIDGGRHLSSIIEEKHKDWSSQWGTVIEVVADLGTDKLEEMSRSERSATLHKRAAAKNAFFSTQEQHLDSESHPETPEASAAA